MRQQQRRMAAAAVFAALVACGLVALADRWPAPAQVNRVQPHGVSNPAWHGLGTPCYGHGAITNLQVWGHLVVTACADGHTFGRTVQ